MKKTKIVVISLVVIISIMVLAGLATSLWGVELHSVEEEIANLENANSQIKEQIVSKTSLTKLYDESEQLGFAKPDRVIYVEGNASVAQAR